MCRKKVQTNLRGVVKRSELIYDMSSNGPDYFTMHRKIVQSIQMILDCSGWMDAPLAYSEDELAEVGAFFHSGEGFAGLGPVEVFAYGAQDG
jgi:hypothetical protein